MKKHRYEETFLEELRKVPNVSLACQKTNLSRNSVYKWCKEDSNFKLRMEMALRVGVESISDLAESTIVQKIQSGDMGAAKYWLDNHKGNYIRPRTNKIIAKLFKENLDQEDMFDKILIESGIKEREVSERDKISDPDILF